MVSAGRRRWRTCFARRRLITPWSEALLGASAFVFVALILGVQLWQAPVLGAGAAGVVIAVTLYGLWLGRPAWFYPWAGAALSIPLAAGYIAFAVLHREVPRLFDGSVNGLAVAGLAGAALYFPVGLFVVCAGILVAVRRDWLDASVLLSPLPGVLAAIIAMHRAGGPAAGGDALSGTAALLFGVYLCMAVATLMLLRAPVRSLKVMTLVGSALLLLSGSTLLVDPGGGVATLAGRAAMLIAFLLSPALVARHA